MLITKKTLCKLFEDSYNGKPVVVGGLCKACRDNMKLTIEKTSGGFGFIGGVLYESESGQLSMKCEDCFNTTSDRSVSSILDFACCHKLFHVSSNKKIFRERLKALN